MTEQERMRILNEHYEHDKAQITKDETEFGNMNYYLKKEEFIRKHLWNNAAQVRQDIIEAMKSRIRGY